MANISYVTSNRLTEESKSMQARSRKIVLIVGAPVVIGAFIYNDQAGWVALIIAFFVFVSQRGSDVIEAGAKGEDIALKLLKKLPDSFTIFNQVDIPSKKSRTGVVEADLVVSGPSTVFVIEVKHNNGEIQCDESSPQWSVTKTGRGGTRYGKEMRNPVKQVKSQVWLLGEYLKGKKAKPWIQPIVLFTNPDVVLSRSAQHTVPVLKAAEIVDYMNSFKSNSDRPVKAATVQALAALKA